MNKADLVAHVASKTGATKKLAAESVEAVLAAVTSSLKKGDSVTLTGFGTFKVVARKARTGRNPQTGATIKIPATKVPRFSAGKALKESVR
ncbi:MAG: HU family DNA-binding protein [bacterium]